MNNKFLGESTNKNDFNYKSPEREKAEKALEAKNELRKAHFNFGSSGDSYITTN
jgi:hypothetical protein